LQESSKLKILFVLEVDIRNGGGLERVIYHYMKMFPREGFESYLLMTDLMDDERLPASAVDEFGDRVMRVRGHRPHGLAARLRKGPYLTALIDYIILHYYGFRYRGEILRALEGREFDVIYFGGLAMSFYFSRHRDGAILIGSDQNGLPRPTGIMGRLKYLMLWHDLSRFDAIHMLSNKVRGETYAGVRTFLVPNGIRSDLFQPDFEGHGDDRTAKFYFGARLFPCKGLRLLLEAWRIALERGLSNAELHVFGSGPDSILLKEMKLPGVFYHGYLPHSELAALVRGMDFLVYPTSCDGFSLVVAEALASGCHAIVSDFLRGVWDEEEKLGFLEYAPRDPAILARRIIDAARNLNRYRDPALKRKQYEHMRDNYDWNRVVPRLANEIRKVVEARAVGSQRRA